MRTVLAVDGGNSKTDVALVGEDGSVLATARGGAFVPERGAARAATAVDVVVAAVRSALGPGPDRVADHVAAYVSGADLPIEEERLHAEFAARGLGGTVEVGNDSFALLRAGASAGWGAAVVCGAGTNAVGVGPDGRTARFPALGRLSGDWGGGAHLGEEVLWHAIRAEDGRGPATALSGGVTEAFGTVRVEEAAIGVHLGEISYACLDALVPVLFAVAAGGDAVARELVVRQAEEVTALGTVVLRRLDLLGTPTEVVLGGGVLTARHPVLMDEIERRYAERAPVAALVVTDVPPIAGAALLGLDRLGATDAAKARLRARFAGGRSAAGG
ncbi:MAG: N-acetylglucosamine kinase [Actinomadura sp.]